MKLSQREVESLVSRGFLTVATMITGEGEHFTVAIGARAEFRHLVVVCGVSGLPGERSGGAFSPARDQKSAR